MNNTTHKSFNHQTLLNSVLTTVMITTINCTSTEEPNQTQGCINDTECHNERICVSNTCVTLPEKETTTISQDQCGNSPFFGKYLYVGCSWAIYMAKDCRAWYTDDGINYDHETKDNATRSSFNMYHGTQIKHMIKDTDKNISEISTIETLQSSLRFSDDIKHKGLWKKVNEMLDKYHGYASTNTEEGVASCDPKLYDPSRCTILFPFDKPFRGDSYCEKNTEFDDLP